MSRRPSGKPFARYKHVTRMCRFVYPHRRQSNLADGRLSARPGIADAGWGRDLRKWYREKGPQLLRKRVIVTETGHSPEGGYATVAQRKQATPACMRRVTSCSATVCRVSVESRSRVPMNHRDVRIAERPRAANLPMTDLTPWSRNLL